jgi:hypothetical protein
MAQPSLPVLSHPSFPQVLARTLEQEVNRVCQPQLFDPCSRTYELLYGSGQFVSCGRRATIVNVSTEEPFCFSCWLEVGRG